MNRSIRRALVVTAATAIALSPVFLVAGPLDPPPGPVAPTGRTQIFSIPFIIDAPGSYVVARHLQRLPGTSAGGITINADDVTIDLNGFSLNGDGNPLSTGAIVLNGHAGVKVFNGVIKRWGTGVRGPGAANCLLEDIQFSSNGASQNNGYGVELGDRATLRNCNFHQSYLGERVGAGARIVGCSFINGGGHVEVGDGSEVERSYFDGGGYAPSSLRVGARSVVKECRIVGSGLQHSSLSILGDGATVKDNWISAAADRTCISLISNGTQVFRNALQTTSTTPISNISANDVGPIGPASAATSPWANIIN